VNGLNIRLNIHNVVMIGVVAILVILAFRMAAKTQLAGLPIVGNVVRVGASA
jgi:hypothetical protein